MKYERKEWLVLRGREFSGIFSRFQLSPFDGYYQRAQRKNFILSRIRSYVLYYILY